MNELPHRIRHVTRVVNTNRLFIIFFYNMILVQGLRLLSVSSRRGIKSTNRLYQSSTCLKSQDNQSDFTSHDGSSFFKDFKMDPSSSQAKSLTSSMGISSKQHEQLEHLSELVVDWNSRLNLISRKDCSVPVVFGRHILPSIALKNLNIIPNSVDGNASNESSAKVIDVGTGGGFPGVPLAIIYPECSFVLVDSVGKKLKAIEEMVAELGLTNTVTRHCRAELLHVEDDSIDHLHAYDVCVGRSVTALPRFCFWIQNLLKQSTGDNKAVNSDEGKLIYIIGGDIEDGVMNRALMDVPIDQLLEHADTSEKRALVFKASSVSSIATESGEKVPQLLQEALKQKKKDKRKQAESRPKRKIKGAWSKRDNSVKKDRGYDNFQRYDAS